MVGWYNYDTREYDDGPADMTSAAAMCPYIPDIPAARNLYQALIASGKYPVRAAIHVHESVLGIQHTIEVVGV
jgi:hypothetical protein